MDVGTSDHEARIGGVKQAFSEANARLIARLEGAADADAGRTPAGGGWSAAQIGYHVAAVTEVLAGMMSGDLAGATPAPEGFAERPWAEIGSGVPAKMEAPIRLRPPAGVTRADALARLRRSGDRLTEALDALTPERASGYCVTYAPLGTVSLYQVGEWATAHVMRHNKQAKLTLSQAGSGG